MKKHIANIITLIRLVGAINLLSLKVGSKPFIIVYTICGMTDALDGFVARKLHIESELGKKLDSISDLAFFSVLMYKIYPILIEILPEYMMNAIWTIVGIRLACYAFVFVRDKKLASEHFILNKATGLLMYFIPYLIQNEYFKYYGLLIVVVAFVAAIHEFKFHLTNK